MSDLPKGWQESTLGETAEIIGGGTPSSSNPDYFSNNAGIAWVTPADLSGFTDIYISRGKRLLSEAGLKNSSARLMPQGTVLFSSRAPIGYVAIAANEISTNQGFKSLIPRKGIVSEYLYFYMRYAKPLAEELASGTTFQEISGKNVARIKFLVPPLNEQKRIVEKLEKLLGRVEAVQARLDKIPAILKRFRQSVLAAACSGKLTADWRDESLDGDLPENWTVGSFDSLLKMIDGDRGPNYPKQHDYQVSGHCLFLSTKNVRRFGFQFDDLTFLTREKHEALRSGLLSRGDIVVTTRGTLGNVAVYDDSVQFDVVRINSGMLILRPKTENVLNLFLKLFIASPLFFEQLEDKRSGSAQPQLPARVLKTFSIAVPPLEEQKEIVRRVEELFKFADTVEERYKKAKAHTDKLTQSILAKAFRGELVPQDPNDEPAFELLKRLKAAK